MTMAYVPVIFLLLLFTHTKKELLTTLPFARVTIIILEI
jgi:hypothetical protein